jgi:hypothetical protein
MTTRAWIAVCATSMVFSANVLRAQATGTLNGLVLEPSGVAIANAVVSLRWNNSSDPMSWNGVKSPPQKSPRKKTFTVATDNTGGFSVPLVFGVWDVFAYRDGFVPVCTVVEIEAGKATAVELRFPRTVQTSLQ